MNLIIQKLMYYTTAEEQGNRKPFCYTPLEHFRRASPPAKIHVIMLSSQLE